LFAALATAKEILRRNAMTPDQLAFAAELLARGHRAVQQCITRNSGKTCVHPESVFKRILDPAEVEIG